MIDVSSDGIEKVLLSNEELHECKQTDMLSVLIPCRPCLHALSKYPPHQKYNSVSSSPSTTSLQRLRLEIVIIKTVTKFSRYSCCFTNPLVNEGKIFEGEIYRRVSQKAIIPSRTSVVIVMVNLLRVQGKGLTLDRLLSWSQFRPCHISTRNKLNSQTQSDNFPIESYLIKMKICLYADILVLSSIQIALSSCFVS